MGMKHSNFRGRFGLRVAALLALLTPGWPLASWADEALPAEGAVTASLMFDMSAEAGPATIPSPLSAADAQAYERAFRLQRAGDWAGAEREMASITDSLLKGHVLARRLLARDRRAAYPELRGWMDEYADHPQAEAVHDLARAGAKGFKGAGMLKQPVKGSLRGAGIDTSDDGANWESSSIRSERGSAAARKVKTRFRVLLRQGRHAQATVLMTGPEAARLDRLDMDEMRLAQAADHFAAGRDQEAAILAEAVAERFGLELPHTHWIAALAWWRQGDIERARRHFEKVANATDSSPWMIAAGAFWAARANLKVGRPEVVNHWFEMAAAYPRTFYGLLARRWLGHDTRFAWETPPFTQADAEILLRVPGARRAMALLQVGETQAAEDELRKAFPRATKAVRQSMLALANTSAMPALAVRLGALVPGEDGRVQDAAAFPVPDWTPKGGWSIDRALVFAFVRQESSFNPKARSRAGAAGLMQLMPRTAAVMAGRKARERLARDSLADPEFNLALGQRYLMHLLSDTPVSGGLLQLAAAYNAGPGNLSKWLAGMEGAKDDPLLFIETLPSRETRAFVERVMTNYWIYQGRLGQDTPSLDSMAVGDWPRYAGDGR